MYTKYNLSSYFSSSPVRGSPAHAFRDNDRLSKVDASPCSSFELLRNRHARHICDGGCHISIPFSYYLVENVLSLGTWHPYGHTNAFQGKHHKHTWTVNTIARHHYYSSTSTLRLRNQHILEWKTMTHSSSNTYIHHSLLSLRVKD